MPVSARVYSKIKKKWGHRTSWAIWSDDEMPEGRPSKSNVGDIELFDENTNPEILELCNPDFILLGLNCSNEIKLDTFANFHSPKGGDYKLRYALKNSPLWGAYMTDFFKDHSELKGKKVLAYYKNKPMKLQANVDSLREEIKELGTKSPTIVCLGWGLYKTNYIQKNFPDYSVIHIPHYAGAPNNPQIYRLSVMKHVIDQIGFEPWNDSMENGWTLSRS